MILHLGSSITQCIFNPEYTIAAVILTGLLSFFIKYGSPGTVNTFCVLSLYFPYVLKGLWHASDVLSMYHQAIPAAGQETGLFAEVFRTALIQSLKQLSQIKSLCFLQVYKYVI